MGGLFAAAGTPVETVRSWRYHLDADAAAGQRLTVGLRFTATGDELTVRVRHSILLVDDGVADDCDAVVELTAEALADDADVTTASGDDTAWSLLRSWLDLEVTGFHMHMR